MLVIHSELTDFLLCYAQKFGTQWVNKVQIITLKGIEADVSKVGPSFNSTLSQYLMQFQIPVL